MIKPFRLSSVTRMDFLVSFGGHEVHGKHVKNLKMNQKYTLSVTYTKRSSSEKL